MKPEIEDLVGRLRRVRSVHVEGSEYRAIIDQAIALVGELERERDEAKAALGERRNAWKTDALIAQMADARALISGLRPGLAAVIADAETRILTAEARIRALEESLERACDAMRMTALAMEAPLGRPTKRHVQYWTSLFHAEAKAARDLLVGGDQTGEG